MGVLDRRLTERTNKSERERGAFLCLQYRLLGDREFGIEKERGVVKKASDGERGRGRERGKKMHVVPNTHSFKHRVEVNIM